MEIRPNFILVGLGHGSGGNLMTILVHEQLSPRSSVNFRAFNR